MKNEPDSHELEKLAAAFESDTSTGEAIRLGLFEQLQTLHRSRANHVQRQQTRLAESVGADDPAVAALGRELRNEQQFISEIATEMDKIRAGRPNVDQETWVLHGYVRNEQREPQPNLTISLTDSSGHWSEALGYACTDQKGYFQLRWTAGEEKHRGSAEAANSRSEHYIQVTDANRKVLYRDRSAVRVTPGAVHYREIVLGDEEAGQCSEPAEVPRATPAAPRKQRSSGRSSDERASSV